MRLINTSTLELEEFLDDRAQTYAILSHRWEDDEVSLQDMQMGAENAQWKHGFEKIKKCCELAKENGLRYAWVDTCCIDKTSSAELSEAINSMYRWYQNATFCYAYLFDVRHLQGTWEWDAQQSDFGAHFLSSAWWTRGWTLQELIAPSNVVFYNSAWQELGTKSTLKSEIVSITGIDVAMLEGSSLENFSIAKRMSWAATRTTTRVEDIAYSLLGLFAVNMPMLYGEGDRAFVRLQEEIMKQSDDHSLFAWSSKEEHSRGLLAKSPADFRSCRNIVPSGAKWNRSPYSNTNLGLSIELPMVAWAMDTYLVGLDCEDGNHPNSRQGIFLKLLPDSSEKCVRISSEGRDIQIFDETLISHSQYRKTYVRQNAWGASPPLEQVYGFHIRKFPTSFAATHGDSYALSDVVSWSQWDEKERMLILPSGKSGTAGVVWYESRTGYSYFKLGFDLLFNPVCEFGGPFWGADSRFYRVNQPKIPLEEKLHNDWMKSHEGWFHEGNRSTGLRVAHQMYRINIGLSKSGRLPRIWVVDVERSEEKFLKDDDEPRIQYAACDGCDVELYSTMSWFKCKTCTDFDLCTDCHKEAAKKHPNHRFKSISGAKYLIERERAKKKAEGDSKHDRKPREVLEAEPCMDGDDENYSMNALFEE